MSCMVLFFIFLSYLCTVPPHRLGSYWQRVMLIVVLLYIAPIITLSLALSKTSDKKNNFIGIALLNLFPLVGVGMLLIYCNSLFISVIDCKKYKDQNLLCADQIRKGNKLYSQSHVKDMDKKRMESEALQDAHRALSRAQLSHATLGITTKQFQAKYSQFNRNIGKNKQQLGKFTTEIEKIRQKRKFRRSLIFWIMVVLIILISFFIVYFFSTIKSFFTL